MSAYDILSSRGVTRLCHFTKLQSFTHIITSPEGILSSDSIRQDTKNVLDSARYDGELDHVCCSIQYPSSWFLNKAIERNSDQIFKDFIVLYIDLSILNEREAKYCPCNSSRENGAYICSDMDSIDSIFAGVVRTFKYPRSPKMLQCCPTDGQAEILIKGNIPPKYITGIAVGNQDIASRVYGILKVFNTKLIPIYIAPDVLTTRWSNMIKNGRCSTETLFDCSSEEV